MLVDSKKQEVIQNTLHHKRYRNNTAKESETMVLLELIVVIKMREEMHTLAK